MLLMNMMESTHGCKGSVARKLAKEAFSRTISILSGKRLVLLYCKHSLSIDNRLSFKTQESRRNEII